MRVVQVVRVFAVLGRGRQGAGAGVAETKEYTIEFFVGQVGADGSAGEVGDLLQRLQQGGIPVYQSGSLSYDIRDLMVTPKGAFGVFAKYRTSDIPHIGVPGGGEREVEINDDEGLIEKNHFLYYRKRQLLIWQLNRHGSTERRFAEYLCDCNAETVAFHPVYQPDAVRRLMRNEVVPRALTVSMARPTNPELFRDNELTRGLVSILSQAEGTRLQIRITSDLRSTDAADRRLSDRVKAAMRELAAERTVVSVAKMDVEEDGITHPLDLLHDRITSRQSVEMAGRYPLQTAMFEALKTAHDEEGPALDEYFGSEDSLV